MTPRELEIRSLIRAALECAAPLLAGHQVVLFGSRARGDAGVRSDFDLGVDGDAPLELDHFFAIEDQLENVPTLYKIDWVDLRRVSPEFRKRALRHCEVLYEQ